MTMALILATARRIAEGDPVEERGQLIDGLVARRMLGRPFAASGSASSAWDASARHWRAAPAPSACNPLPQPPPVAPEIEHELEATYWDSLDQMLARMDIVSVNCPHTPATYHLSRRAGSS